MFLRSQYHRITLLTKSTNNNFQLKSISSQIILLLQIYRGWRLSATNKYKMFMKITEYCWKIVLKTVLNCSLWVFKAKCCTAHLKVSTIRWLFQWVMSLFFNIIVAEPQVPCWTPATMARPPHQPPVSPIF